MTENLKWKLDDLAERYKALEEENRQLRQALKFVRTPREGVWRWMGDDTDHPESLGLDTPVVMSGEQLNSALALARANAVDMIQRVAGMLKTGTRFFTYPLGPNTAQVAHRMLSRELENPEAHIWGRAVPLEEYREAVRGLRVAKMQARRFAARWCEAVHSQEKA